MAGWGARGRAGPVWEAGEPRRGRGAAGPAREPVRVGPGRAVRVGEVPLRSSLLLLVLPMWLGWVGVWLQLLLSMSLPLLLPLMVVAGGVAAAPCSGGGGGGNWSLSVVVSTTS